MELYSLNKKSILVERNINSVSVCDIIYYGDIDFKLFEKDLKYSLIRKKVNELLNQFERVYLWSVGIQDEKITHKHLVFESNEHWMKDLEKDIDLMLGIKNEDGNEQRAL